jgi:hypothetical protein
MAGKTFFVNQQAVHGSDQMTGAALKDAAGIPRDKALYDADTGKRVADDAPVGNVERLGAIQNWEEGA